MERMKLDIQKFAPEIPQNIIFNFSFKNIEEADLPVSITIEIIDSQGYNSTAVIDVVGLNFSDEIQLNGDLINTQEYLISSIEVISQDKYISVFRENNNEIFVDIYDKETFSGCILNNSVINTGIPDFSSVATTDEGVYVDVDNIGNTYYFRGAVTNNYVKFANFWWRIIRVNGNGSVRLIYDGTTVHANGESSTDRRIGKSVFNTNRFNNAYVGYMYGTPGSTTYEETHANINNSEIKTILDSWYESNLSNYTNYIDIGAGFWGDRTLSRGSGTGTSSTDYGARYRLYTNKTPTFERSDKDSDLYTVGESNKGNKALTYPIGLITADEVAYAGGVWDTSNSSYYLYTNGEYWTLSPSYFFRGSAGVFIVYSKGSLSGSYVDDSCDVRPVINLRGDLFVTGTGTSTDPYEVSLPAVPITNFNGAELTNIYYNGTEISKMYCNGVLVFKKGPSVVYKRRIMVGDNLKNRNIYSDFSENFSNELINYYSGSSNSNVFISPVNSDNTIINKFHDIYGRPPGGDIVRVEFSDEHVFYFLHTNGTVEINNIFSMSSDINYEVGEVVEDDPSYRHIYIEDNKIRPVQVGDKIVKGTKLYFNFPDNLTNIEDKTIFSLDTMEDLYLRISSGKIYITDREGMFAPEKRSTLSIEPTEEGFVLIKEIFNTEDSLNIINLSTYTYKCYGYQEGIPVNEVDNELINYVLVDTTTLGA